MKKQKVTKPREIKILMSRDTGGEPDTQEHLDRFRDMVAEQVAQEYPGCDVSAGWADHDHIEVSDGSNTYIKDRRGSDHSAILDNIEYIIERIWDQGEFRHADPTLQCIIRLKPRS